jgi:hypothetical protein
MAWTLWMSTKERVTCEENAEVTRCAAAFGSVVIKVAGRRSPYASIEHYAANAPSTHNVGAGQRRLAVILDTLYVVVGSSKCLSVLQASQRIVTDLLKKQTC